MTLICGDCGIGKHQACDGLLHTQHGFCRCADRDHQPLDVQHAIAVVERELAIEAANLAIRARNDDLFTRGIRRIWQEEPA